MIAERDARLPTFINPGPPQPDDNEPWENEELVAKVTKEDEEADKKFLEKPYK